MKVNIIKSTRLLSCLIVVSLFFFSCSKEGNSDSGVISNNQVSFTIGGISDFDDVGNMSSLVKHTSSKVIVENDDDIVWELTSMDVNQRNGLSVNQNQSTAIELKNKAANKAATSAVNKEVKYRVLIYEYTGGVVGEFSTSKQIIVGDQDGSIILSPNKSYYYIAYSYNNTADIAPVSDTNSPIIKSKTDAPLLYASGDFTLDGSDKNIQIIFRHQVSQIEVLVDVTPMTASITSLVASFQDLSLSTQDFNLKTGQLIAGTTISQTVNSAINFENLVLNDASVEMSTNKYYTVDRNPNIVVKFADFKVNRGGVIENVLNGTNNGVVSTNNFSSTVTGIKRAKIVVDKRGTVISGIEWATGNLYYDASAPEGKRYKIASEVTSFNSTHEACNYYWNYNTIYPRSITGDSYGPLESSVSKDPCKLIAGGQWRLPHIGEFGVLFNTAVATVRNSSGANTIYVEAKTGGKRVYFHEAGYVRSGGNGCLFDSQIGKMGRYRADGLQAGNKFGYYYAVEKSAQPKHNLMMSTDALRDHETVIELANLTLGINLNKGFSIRCIRTGR